MGLRFQVGNGESISVWDDPWISVLYSFRPYSLPMESTEELRVCDLIDPDTGDWNVWWLNELFMGGEVDNIACISLSNGGGEDKVAWHFDDKGLYSVKNGYHVARMTNQLGNIASTSDSNNALGVIWDTRNDVLWNGGSYDLGRMQRRAKDLLVEMWNTRKSMAARRRESYKRGGIGVVVWNEHGVCMAALAQPLEYAHTALQVEAEALQAGILIAIHEGWEMVEIESDCSMLGDALHRDEGDFSMLGRIVEDCRRYAQ
ncbi:hypothetical protein ACLB2K_060385 [Fragaria x ananassa]